jgi:hypothetical protein
MASDNEDNRNRDPQYDVTPKIANIQCLSYG